MPDCECSLSNKLQAFGIAASLCHHSPPGRVRQVQQDLYQTLAEFANTVDTDQLFTALTPMAEQYSRVIAQDDYELLTRNEHNTLMVSFLRQLSLSAQIMMATMLLNRDPEDR